MSTAAELLPRKHSTVLYRGKIITLIDNIVLFGSCELPYRYVHLGNCTRVRNCRTPTWRRISPQATSKNRPKTMNNKQHVRSRQ